MPANPARTPCTVVSIAAWLLVVAQGASAAPWPTLHFAAGTGFHHTLAVGDLNGDGWLDVATPNSPASAITVLLGSGDGSLGAWQAYAAFGEPQDALMVDVTGDGILDLAAADYLGSGVAVLAGSGDGTFAPGVTYPAGARLVSLAAADLDGDGRLDLAVSKEAGNVIAVLPALATGGFGVALEVATGATPHQIGAADFDGDGLPDLAVASHGASAVSVHLGSGTHVPGVAASFAAAVAPVGLTIADLDSDGNADLVVSHVNTAAISVLLGNGDGTFAAPVAYPTDPRPRGMDAGDLDGDGTPEIVVATGYPDGDSVLTVYRGVGDGTLALLTRLELPYRAADCVVADMNGDGRRDIVATGPHAGVVSVLLNPGGTLSASPPTANSGDLELQVHPNPAHASVRIRFRTRAGTDASLEILDPSGRRVAALGPFRSGSNEGVAEWHGDQISGGRAAPGLYFVRLTDGVRSTTRRLVLIAP